MTTTKRQDDAFAEHMKPEVSRIDLEMAAEWIGDQLCPEDVFKKERLEIWAEENGFVKMSENPLDHYDSTVLWTVLLNGGHLPAPPPEEQQLHGNY